MSTEKCENGGILFIELILFISPGRDKRIAAGVIAAVSKSINGTGCWLTILTMTARESSWIGSCSPRAAFVGAILEVGAGCEKRRLIPSPREGENEMSDGEIEKL